MFDCSMLPPSTSITCDTSRKWLDRYSFKVGRYLRDNHRRETWDRVKALMYYSFPDEAVKLVSNFGLTDRVKTEMFVDFIIREQQVTFTFFADQRRGKDSGLCYLFELAIERMNEAGRIPPRIVTLQNIKIPPFVNPEDRYWSFKDIPVADFVFNPKSGIYEKREVWIYCSELEVVLPARDSKSPENDLFDKLSGTLAQNGQKLFGGVKLASKVDLNVLRSTNAMAFKYIDPIKLQMNNVERENVLGELGSWLLPYDRQDYGATLLYFDKQYFAVNLPLPDWWTQDYSEQFKNVSTADIWEFVDGVFDEGARPQSVLTIIAQKFRNKTITKSDVVAHFKTKS